MAQVCRARRSARRGASARAEIEAEADECAERELYAADTEEGTILIGLEIDRSEPLVDDPGVAHLGGGTEAKAGALLGAKADLVGGRQSEAKAEHHGPVGSLLGVGVEDVQDLAVLPELPGFDA